MTKFDDMAPGLMNLLMRDFPEWGPEDAAADLGNAGHECAGFEDLVEKTSEWGGEGGIGWYQWTGQTPNNPRRRDFEDYCRRNGFDRFSDKANYGYHFVELRGSEKAAIAKTKKAVGLDAKVEAFELSYERAGAKHYDSRKAYARRALSAWQKNPSAPIPAWAGGKPVEPVSPKPPTPAPKPVETPVEKVQGDAVIVEVKNSWWSKINIVSVVTFAITMLSVAGIVIPEDMQKTILEITGLASPLIVVILRTWFTRSVTPSAANKK